MLRLGFVVSEFPRAVDAYLLRELQSLDASGFELLIFSLYPGWRGEHAMARSLRSRTRYAPGLLSRDLLSAQSWHLSRSPRPYARALIETMRMGAGNPWALCQGLATFPRAVYFAGLAAGARLDHIHANWATYPATAAFVMSSLTGIPYSFAGHATDIFVRTAGLRRRARSARFVLTCTEDAGAHLRNLCPEAADRIAVCHHGVDLDALSPAPLPGGPLHVLAIGTLRACKGFDDLVAACGLLAQWNVDFRCTIVGDGEERRSLSRQIERLGLGSRVRLTGYVPQEQVALLYREASVVALPARLDGHFGVPNVVLEGLACGRPAVCTRLRALSEIGEGSPGVLFIPERSPGALAATLQRLARDPQAVRRIGEAGRRAVAARFDIRETTARLRGLFEGNEAASGNTTTRTDGGQRQRGLDASTPGRAAV